MDVDGAVLGIGFVVHRRRPDRSRGGAVVAAELGDSSRRKPPGRSVAGRRVVGLAVEQWSAPDGLARHPRGARSGCRAGGRSRAQRAVGTILSITMVVGTLTFGANLVHLVTTPPLYGQTWQASVDTQFQAMPPSLMKSWVNHRPGVVAWSSGDFGTVDVMGSHVPAIGLSRGEGSLVGPTLVTGRLPTARDEVALGASVLRLVHRQVGQDLRLSVNGVPRTMHIVGQAVFPAFDQGSFTSTDLGLGAAVTAADLVQPGTSVADSSEFLLVRFAPGPDQAREVQQPEPSHRIVLLGSRSEHLFRDQAGSFRHRELRAHRRRPPVPGPGVGRPRRGRVRAIDDRLGPAPSPRHRRPQDDGIRPSPGPGARDVAGGDIRRGFIAHRGSAGHLRRPCRVGPLCG